MQAWEIAKKDLLLQGRDMRALTVLIILPMIFITILGMTFGKLLGWQAENQILKIAFVDNIDYASIKGDGEDERTGYFHLDADQKKRNARQLFVNMMNSLQKRDGIKVEEKKSTEIAEQEIASGKVGVAVLVGPEFFKRIDDYETGIKVEDLMDQDRPDGRLKQGLASLDMSVTQRKGFEGTGSVVEQMVFADTLRIIVSYVACTDPQLHRRNAEKCKEWAVEYDKDAPRPEPDAANNEKKAGDAKTSAVYNKIVPGLTVMFVFFLINIMARSFIAERDIGTLRRLRIAPLTATSLLLGKVLPFFLISIVQTTILFGAGKLIFDMTLGPEPWLLVPTVLCTSLAATSLGLLVSTMVKTDSQVSAYANIVVIGMAGLSGCLIPRDLMPPNMLLLGKPMPHSWAVIAFREILVEDNVIPDHQVVFQSCAILIGFSLIYFLIGVYNFAKAKQ
jgi:ABC-2 type transport system permease protein